MQPGLRDQDRLFIDKFFFRFEKISRGDVVVFHYPRDPEKSYIKRIIALPGDSIFIDHGRVWVNDQPLDEPYVPHRYLDTRSMPEILIPSSDYFVMGDHRSISSDSRDFGPVDRDLIYGKSHLHLLARRITWASFARQRQAAVYNPIPPLLKKNPPLTHP